MSETNRPSQIPAALWARMPESAKTVFGALQGEGGIAKLMMRPTFGEDEDGEPVHSQAELIADMFNIMRMDVKAMADAADVDVTIEKMTPESAAELVQGIVSGQDLRLMEKFNQLEDKRERVLLKLADEETLQRHRKAKIDMMYTEENDE